MVSTARPGSSSPVSQDFVPLRRRNARSAPSIGCLARLSGLLVAFGLWLVAFSVLIRPEMPTARVQVAVGVALAGVGALGLVRMLRRIQASAASRVELALPAGCVLYPGASVPLRVRLAGPARVDRLVVRAICERHFTREVMAPGSTAVATTNEVEELWREELLDERGVEAPARGPVDRVLTLALSTLARPTGPILPAGTATWRLEVASGPDAKDGDAYAIHVFPSAETATDSAIAVHQPQAAAARQVAGADVSTGIGCAVLTLAFLLVGPFFLWLYFSDAPTKRGNPIMALVVGVMFTAVGVLALATAIKGLFKRSPKGRGGGPPGPRLP